MRSVQKAREFDPGFNPDGVLLTSVVLLGTLAWAWGFTNIYRAGNTRLQASRWIFQNVPGLPIEEKLVVPNAAIAPAQFCASNRRRASR